MKKTLIILSLVLSSAFCDWASVDIVDPAADGDDSAYESSDPSEEFSDSDPSDTLGICWMQTYGRVKHGLTGECEEGLVAIDSYCYHPCKEGYVEGFFSGLDCEVCDDPDTYESTSDVESYCWEKCPKGFEDEGSDCYSPKEKKYVNKKSYNRTYVEARKCAEGQEFADGECYEVAREGFYCDGSLCYGKCPKGWGLCGAFCAKIGLCQGDVLNEGFDVQSSLSIMAEHLRDPAKADWVNATAVRGVLNGTQYPWCK